MPYPAWVYAAFRAIEIGLALGLLAFVARWLVALARRRVSFDRRWAGAALLILWLALLAFSWVRFMRIAPAAQGRYFFPAAPSLALLMIVGLAGFRSPRISLRAVRRRGMDHRRRAGASQRGHAVLADPAGVPAATPGGGGRCRIRAG